jgi:hypothetical protein
MKSLSCFEHAPIPPARTPPRHPLRTQIFRLLMHSVAGRFLDRAHRQALVLDCKTGELVGMLTAFDVLKAKNWELMQEMPEPSRLSAMSLLRFGSRATVSEVEEKQEK